MKVLVPGKATAKTAIGECGTCEAIVQEVVTALVRDPTGHPGVDILGMVHCPNCGNSVRMFALDSNAGRTTVAKVATYQAKVNVRNIVKDNTF